MQAQPGRRLPVCQIEQSDEPAFRRWFKQHRPDAILTNGPHRLLSWLDGLGLQAPRDVGIAGLEYRRDLACTGLYYDPARVGGLAVEMLVGLLHRNETGVPPLAHEMMVTGEPRENPLLAVKAN